MYSKQFHFRVVDLRTKTNHLTQYYKFNNNVHAYSLPLFRRYQFILVTLQLKQQHHNCSLTGRHLNMSSFSLKMSISLHRFSLGLPCVSHA